MHFKIEIWMESMQTCLEQIKLFEIPTLETQLGIWIPELREHTVRDKDKMACYNTK